MTKRLLVFFLLLFAAFPAFGVKEVSKYHVAPRAGTWIDDSVDSFHKIHTFGSDKSDTRVSFPSDKEFSRKSVCVSPDGKYVAWLAQFNEGDMFCEVFDTEQEKNKALLSFKYYTVQSDSTLPPSDYQVLIRSTGNSYELFLKEVSVGGNEYVACEEVVPIENRGKSTAETYTYYKAIRREGNESHQKFEEWDEFLSTHPWGTKDVVDVDKLNSRAKMWAFVNKYKWLGGGVLTTAFLAGLGYWAYQKYKVDNDDTAEETEE